MKNVLLINDSKFECIIIKDILNNLGYDVAIGDENNALSLIMKYKSDFVIVNYIMKEINGDQLISIIKAKNPNIKCILSSSNAIKLEQFHHKKIDALFHTPIDRQGLANVFKSIDANDKKDAGEIEVVKPGKKEKLNPELIRNDSPNFCPYCGHQLDKVKSFAFCPFCGHKL